MHNSLYMKLKANRPQCIAIGIPELAVSITTSKKYLQWEIFLFYFATIIRIQFAIVLK